MTKRSAEELEREAERIRTGIARTSDALKERMSPGQMVDEVAHYLRDSDASIALDTLRRQVRDNPLPLVLIGAGLAWLMLGSGPRERVSYQGYGGDHRFDDTDTARPGALGAAASGPATHFGMSGHGAGVGTIASTASGAGRDVSHRAGDMAQRATEATHAMTEQARGFVGEAAGQMRAAGHEASDRLGGAVHHASEAIGGWAHDAAERGRSLAHASRQGLSQGSRSLTDALEREPLVLGGIGLAVGAAIGAMLPSTRIEAETLGEARHRLVHEAGRVLDQAAVRAERAAADAYAAGREAAEREGLVPGEGGKPLAERLGAVAKAAAGAAEADTAAATGGTAGSGSREEQAGSGPTGARAAPSAPAGPGDAAPGSAAGAAPGAAAGMPRPPGATPSRDAP